MPEDKITLSNDATATIDDASEEFWALLVDLAAQKAIKDGREQVETFDVDAVLEEAFKSVRERSASKRGSLKQHGYASDRFKLKQG